MNSYTDKSKKSNGQSAASAIFSNQQNSAAAFQFKDNRQKTVVQQKTEDPSKGIVQMEKKYYRWAGTGNVVECSKNAYKSSKKKATEADYFKHNPAMQAEMTPKVSRTYETATDTAANAGAPATRQRSQSVHVPTRNRSGSFDIRHTHDNVNSGQPPVDRSVGHIDRTGARTGEPARADSRASDPSEITKPESGELTAEQQAEIGS